VPSAVSGTSGSQCGQSDVHQRGSHHPARTCYFSELWRLSIKRLFHSITRFTTSSSTRREESQGHYLILMYTTTFALLQTPLSRRMRCVEIASLLRISYHPPYHRLAVPRRKGCRAIMVSALKAHISSITMGGESWIQVETQLQILRFNKISYVGL
jgi:hypothetical protein